MRAARAGCHVGRWPHREVLVISIMDIVISVKRHAAGIGSSPCWALLCAGSVQRIYIFALVRRLSTSQIAPPGS